MRRRLADGLELNANYLICKLYGNLSGLASSDENGRSSLNVSRFFDGIDMSFDEKGNPTNGREVPGQWSKFQDFFKFGERACCRRGEGLS